jgi:hypothetical protein
MVTLPPWPPSNSGGGVGMRQISVKRLLRTDLAAQTA